MYLVTADEMRSADRYAIEEIGIPGLILMEHAGKHTADAARDILPPGGGVVIVCGCGNNGGDGLVAARHLYLDGIAVTVVMLASEPDLSPDARANFRPVGNLNIPILTLGVDDSHMIESALSYADLIIDAVLGTGIRGEITGTPRTAIDLINAACRPVLAVDLPSGLNADTGQAATCVGASVTVTFGYLKRGLVLYPGARLAGRVIVCDIGLPPESLSEPTAILIDSDLASSWLPFRPPDAHKGTCGRVLVIAGSPGYTGAAILTARSVLRSGAGLCWLGCPVSLTPIIESTAIEVITTGLPETSTFVLGPDALTPAIELAQSCDCIAVGPGLGRSPETAAFIRELIPAVTCPVIIDADGLYPYNSDLSALSSIAVPLILTPHVGEMARLLGTDAANVNADVIGTATEAARRSNAICVLKGATTVISDPDGRIAVNNTGTPGMATAGMGDVLTGAIAGLIGQGVPPHTAAALGTYIHGLAGTVAASKQGTDGLIASDVSDALSLALERLGQRAPGLPSRTVLKPLYWRGTV